MTERDVETKDQARRAVEDTACPACHAGIGEPCVIALGGVDTAGWHHDARILAPVYTALREERPTPPAERRTEGNE